MTHREQTEAEMEDAGLKDTLRSSQSQEGTVENRNKKGMTM